MKVKEFRRLLQARNAKWTIAAEITDDTDLQEISRPFPVGALTPAPGVLTARLPRMRRTPEGRFTPVVPGTVRLLRPVVARQPRAWDWRNVRNNNWVTATKNQGGCGSCVAFAVLGAMESHQRIEENQPALAIDLSEAALFFANERQCNPGDPRYGWWVPTALDCLVDEGACFETNYPYRGVNQNAELIEGTERTLKITGYDSTSQAAQMKRWLCEEGPLVTSFTVYNDFFTHWRNSAEADVYSHVTGDRAGGHAVMVVGYDDGQSCWICRNSWGATARRGDGCFRIAYGECGIDARMYLIQDVYPVWTRDELPYNPAALRIVDEGARGWLLTDGVSRMKMLDNKEDARNALRVARRHTRHGFVGRDNRRRNRIDYITEYWAGDSRLPREPLTRVDAIPYNPTNVVAEDLDARGWRLKEGRHWMLMADDLNDALAILQVVERHTRMCFIGRGNRRPDRKSYIMTYWE